VLLVKSNEVEESRQEIKRTGMMRKGIVSYRIVWARMLQSSYSLVGAKEVQHEGRAETKKREEDRDRVREFAHVFE
jgi:hypothetical protein